MIMLFLTREDDCLEWLYHTKSVKREGKGNVSIYNMIGNFYLAWRQFS